MCGVSGVFGKNNKADYTQISNSLNKISHRGPDASGILELPNKLGFFAHVRLSILDLSDDANQPMIKDKNIIVYNGEIYNHKDIRSEIKTEFTTSCDTETLISAYNQHGIDVLNKMNGMFAGAIYDHKAEKIYLYRDSLGIKNIYYYVDDQAIYFSSEIKGLIDLIPSKLEPNYGSINCYMKYENYRQDTNLFKGIRNLMPGEVLEVSNKDGLKLERHNIVPENSSEIESDLSLEGLHKVLEASVKSHLLSDVPVGVYMSGGIDSSLVASIAAKHTNQIEAFTGFFNTDNKHYDEREITRIVAEKNNIKLHEVEITPDDFIKYFDSVIYALDEPRMGMGSFSQFVVAKKAKQTHKVLLSGHGGDELFAGYPLFKSYYINYLIYKKRWLDFFKFMFNVRAKDWIWVSYFFVMKAFSKKNIYAPAIFNLPDSEYTTSFYGNTNNEDALLKLQEYYEKIYIPGLLIVEDKISMYNSLETRVPLWSSKIKQFAAKIPIELKLSNGTLKYYLKKVAEIYLPQEVINAPKRGFPTPLRLWFRNELKDFVIERLTQENIFLDSIMDLSKRKKLINNHINYPLPFSFDEKRAHKIWMLLCLESWGRQFKL